MERRAFATSKKLWPEADAHCTSPNIEFDNYINKHISFKLLVDMMVGDLQRVLEYPKQGFMIQQCVPPDVLSAYKRLIDHGYISRLIS